MDVTVVENESSRREGVSILLSDADEPGAGMLAAGLRAEGFAVETAASASRALELAARRRFDLAIIDALLADPDGVELGRRLLDDHRIPALYISSVSSDEAVGRVTAQGGLGYLLKPIGLDRLIPLVKVALARARDLRALSDIRDSLEAALAGSRAVSVAVGLVMERHGVSHDEAFKRLRLAARNSGAKLETLATALVSAAESLADLTPAGSRRDAD